MGRMGPIHILPVRLSVTIGTIMKLNGDKDGVGDGVGMWHTLMIDSSRVWERAAMRDIITSSHFRYFCCALI